MLISFDLATQESNRKNGEYTSFIKFENFLNLNGPSIEFPMQ